MKTQGQIDYENELSINPCYPWGELRPAWECLSNIARYSWERGEI